VEAAVGVVCGMKVGVESPGFAAFVSKLGGSCTCFALLDFSITAHGLLASLYFNGDSPLIDIFF
jgi:hypothetical protein